MTYWHLGSSLHFGIGWKKDDAQGDKDHHIPENDQNMNNLYLLKRNQITMYKIRRTPLLLAEIQANCWLLLAPCLPLSMKSQVCLSNDKWWTCIGHGTEAKAMRTIMDWKMELSSWANVTFRNLQIGFQSKSNPSWHALLLGFCGCYQTSLPICSASEDEKHRVLKRAVLGSGHNLKLLMQYSRIFRLQSTSPNSAF